MEKHKKTLKQGKGESTQPSTTHFCYWHLLSQFHSAQHGSFCCHNLFPECKRPVWLTSVSVTSFLASGLLSLVHSCCCDPASFILHHSFVPLSPALINMLSKSLRLVSWNLSCMKSRTHTFQPVLEQTHSGHSPFLVTLWTMKNH